MNLLRSEASLRFDPDSARIWVDGRETQLTPTENAMMRYFAGNSERLIPKAELLDAVWPSTHVTEALVKDYVRKLRRILKDDAVRPRFIVTVRGLGYRFVGTLSLAGTTRDAGTAATAARAAPSIAVLPFADASEDGDQGYFAAGVAEDILVELSRFRSLLVIARDSSFSYDPPAVSANEVGLDLRAEYVLRGSVRRARDRLRIHVQLIEAGTGVCVWSDRYDRCAGDVFAVQAEVSAAVVSTLAGYLEDFGQRKAARKPPGDLEVYDCLLLGNWHLRQGGQSAVVEARRLYGRAMELDPTCARAHAELAFSFLQEFWSDWTPDHVVAVRAACSLAKKAVSLDGLDSRAHLYLAVALQHSTRNFDLADAHFRMSQRLNPNDYDLFCLRAWNHAFSGKPDEGIACATTAIRLSPLTTEDCYGAQCVASYTAGKYDEALGALEHIPDPSNIVNAYRAMCFAKLGRTQKAEAAMADYLAGAAAGMAACPGRDGDRWRQFWTLMMPFRDARDLEHVLDGLRSAGLP